MSSRILDRLRSEVLNLPDAERAELARELVRSLDGPADADAAKEWEAAQEAVEAAAWYESQSSGLGVEFEAALQAAINLLERRVSPLMPLSSLAPKHRLMHLAQSANHLARSRRCCISA
jgi:hypothetical protein